MLLPAPQSQLLVLRNGEVLAGKVAHSDDHYVVQLPNGQVRVKNADVEMVCDNLEEAYRRKRAALQAGDVPQHLALAQWCLHHQLLAPAGDELVDVVHTDPENPMIGVLQHRLKMAKEPAPTADGKTAQPMIGNDELDRMVRSLPRGSVETFTQLVQPVLMNNCMSAGCHGSQGEQGMQLCRASSGKASGRRLTQRNLYTVLQYVDREAPTESRLLKAIQGPHGTSRSPIFSDRQASQYQRIVNWVDMVANQMDSAIPASVALPAIEENPTLASPRAGPAPELCRGKQKGQARSLRRTPARRPPTKLPRVSLPSPARRRRPSRTIRRPIRSIRKCSIAFRPASRNASFFRGGVVQHVVQHHGRIADQRRTDGRKQTITLGRRQPFRRADIAIQQIPADQRAMAGLKPPRKLANMRVGRLLALLIAGCGVSELQSQDHHRAANRAADAAQPPQAAAEPRGKPHRRLSVEMKLLAEHRENCLRTTAAFLKQSGRAIGIVHRSPIET